LRWEKTSNRLLWGLDDLISACVNFDVFEVDLTNWQDLFLTARISVFESHLLSIRKPFGPNRNRIPSRGSDEHRLYIMDFVEHQEELGRRGVRLCGDATCLKSIRVSDAPKVRQKYYAEGV
jgi:hypothetical protein